MNGHELTTPTQELFVDTLSALCLELTMKSLKSKKTITKNASKTLSVARDEDEDAFLATKAERDALPEASLIHPNIDVGGAIGTALAVFPALAAYRPLIEEQFKTFDFKAFDSIEKYAAATSYADSLVTNVNEPQGLNATYEQALTLREAFRADISTLILRKQLDPAKMPKLTNAVGYKNVARDLRGLITAAKLNYSAMEGKSVLTIDEIEKAVLVASALTKLSGAKERSDQDRFFVPRIVKALP